MKANKAVYANITISQWRKWYTTSNYVGPKGSYNSIVILRESTVNLNPYFVNTMQNIIPRNACRASNYCMKNGDLGIWSKDF